jgi:maltooligosyltrehalose trehalohydrolase
MCAGFAGDREGYFEDFRGTAEEIAAVIRNGWVYEGQRSVYHGAPRGTPAGAAPPPRFVHCLQNHDQVGNRAAGDRLGERVSPAAYRAMSALLLLGPYTPLLFMGQEWGARTPFQYFTDHEPELGRNVTEGRRREFARFSAFSGDHVPDPQDPATFARSKLDGSERLRPEHAGILAWNRALLALRAAHPALRRRGRGDFSVAAVSDDGVRLDRRGDGIAIVVLVSLRGRLDLDLGRRDLNILAYSEEPRFGGAASGVPLEGGRVRLDGPAALLLEHAVESPFPIG